MNAAVILIAGVTAVVMFTVVLLAVLGLKELAAWMARLEERDQATAETEGREACRRGEPATANPYSGERSDRFKKMARAWERAYVAERTALSE